MRRIVALLVSLAVLAECVAVRSFPVRLLVLWVLGRAEAAARDYVFEATGAPLHETAGAVPCGSDPADALLLAARLRALAMLGALLPDELLLDRRRGSVSAYARPAQRPGHRGGRRVEACDTS